MDNTVMSNTHELDRYTSGYKTGYNKALLAAKNLHSGRNFVALQYMARKWNLPLPALFADTI